MTGLIGRRVENALDWVELRKGDVLDGEDLVRGIVSAYLRPDLDAPPSHALRIVPLDDDERDFADSILPGDMIEAGMVALEQAQADLKSDDPDAIDWDNGMIAVAVYRAMTGKAPVADAKDGEQTDAGEVHELLDKAKARLASNPDKFLRKDAARLIELVERQTMEIEMLRRER